MGSIQRCAEMYQQGDWTTVRRKDCRCGKVHFKSRIKYRSGHTDVPQREERFLSSEEDLRDAKDLLPVSESRSPDWAACSPLRTEELDRQASPPHRGPGTKEKGASNMAAVKAGRFYVVARAALRTRANQNPESAPADHPEPPVLADNTEDSEEG
uniref:Uncharacterized protein n=1 Tax=Sphaerodactylus townsendi TaxID=933632 RepID=A0ACB8FIR5_9SAUR